MRDNKTQGTRKIVGSTALRTKKVLKITLARDAQANESIQLVKTRLDEVLPDPEPRRENPVIPGLEA